VGKVNVDEQPALAARFSVRSIPTVVILKPKGIVVETIVGLQSVGTYKERLDKYAPVVPF
jgi:thioredoxin-like negative regulator of GroEL